MLKTANYEINSQNLAAHELIGLKVAAENSSDKSKIGIRGKVVYETKNVLVVDTKKGEKKLPKKEVDFVFYVGDEKIELSGKDILARPENRIKLFWRKQHGRM